ncbi:site-specific integrase [Methylibium sp.]|uniref:site-specific integrase n=1 Tax=Methylibium sp. TaxID=2067992 RepID=UPI001814FB73|nr:site-specific integrase [Methylibium sp.]MBA3588859.1 site-specific integrase [Methylibium sp.]
MAWIEKRSHGWVVRWRDADGVARISPPPAYGSKGDAAAAAREFEQRVPPVKRRRDRPGQTPIAPLTIAALAALWHAAQVDNDERMRRPGAQAYIDAARDLAIAAAKRWGEAAKPADVTLDGAAALRRKVPRTAAYLRAILRWARDHHGTALDPRVFTALRPPPSKRSTAGLLTERQVKAALARARRRSQLPIFSCLSTYGWRPITACRLTVGDVDLKRREITIDRKHDGTPHTHPLFPCHVAQLGALVKGRADDAPLFRPPRSKDGVDRWRVSKGGSAAMLAVWFRRNLLPVGVYNLKRFALSRMASGAWPWRAPLSIPDVRLYTGHKADAMVMRYLRTNTERARSLMADFPGGQ